MTLTDFCRVLEEVGLAAWHGDGRTTTVKEIGDHCEASGLTKQLGVFKEGAEAGVTRLLAAFFFRRYGERASGDPTFVFTHKSFGEYLAARRIVRAIDRVNRELKRREESPDEGWDEREALKHWAQICGPSALSKYLHSFLLNELTFLPQDQIAEWQSHLSGLFNYMLRHGMPMEQLPIGSFKQALFQARNAEEALLVALNGCSRLTRRVSVIDATEPTTFGAWFKRIQGQRTAAESSLAAYCLSFLDLRGASLPIGDFYGANLEGCILALNVAVFTCFCFANLQEANLEGAFLAEANLAGANLARARLAKANLQRANLQRANLEGANIEGANFEGARLEGANLQRANIEGANFAETKGRWLDVPVGTPKSPNALVTGLRGLFR
jgi:uncharacterized protein YjbI with pentapeptide repeats